MALIAAQYIGTDDFVLDPAQAPFYDNNGNVITDDHISTGEIIMWPDVDIQGYTLKLDPAQIQQPQYLGLGRVVLPADQGLSDAQLKNAGYVFNQGRSDFVAI